MISTIDLAIQPFFHEYEHARMKVGVYLKGFTRRSQMSAMVLGRIFVNVRIRLLLNDIHKYMGKAFC